MEKITRNVSIIFFLCFFILIPANAQNALKEKDIESYISTLPKLQLLYERSQPENNTSNQSQVQPQDNDLTSRTPITDNLERMRNHPTFDNFSNIVKEAGFANPAHWAATGDKIMLAYSAYFINNPINEDAPTLDELKLELSEQLKKAEGNRFITAEHKELLVNKIQNSMAMLSDPNYIASENISTIGPFIARLNSYLRNTNDTY